MLAAGRDPNQVRTLSAWAREGLGASQQAHPHPWALESPALLAEDQLHSLMQLIQPFCVSLSYSLTILLGITLK